jgi:hypothetical protein
MSKTYIILELRQLTFLKTMMLVRLETLTIMQCMQTLDSIMTMKKCSGNIKGQQCIDRWRQQETFAKEVTHLPPVHIDLVMITSVIAGDQEHEVTVIEVPGAFLSANNLDLVHMSHMQWWQNVLQWQICKHINPFPMRTEKQLYLWNLLRPLTECWDGHYYSNWKIGERDSPDPTIIVALPSNMTANAGAFPHQTSLIWSSCIPTTNHKEVRKLSKCFQGIYRDLSISHGKEHDNLGMVLGF